MRSLNKRRSCCYQNGAVSFATAIIRERSAILAMTALTRRDPPSLLASSELRDLALQPTAVRNARITIIHPQLRDLILPLERGRVLHPRGFGIEEMQWKSAAEVLSRRSSAGGQADEDVSMEGDESFEDALGNKAEVCGISFRSRLTSRLD